MGAVVPNPAATAGTPDESTCPPHAFINAAKLERLAVGRWPAVRLPVAFRFDTDVVFIRRDPVTGNVILSWKPAARDGFRAAS